MNIIRIILAYIIAFFAYTNSVVLLFKLYEWMDEPLTRESGFLKYFFSLLVILYVANLIYYYAAFLIAPKNLKIKHKIYLFAGLFIVLTIFQLVRDFTLLNIVMSLTINIICFKQFVKDAVMFFGIGDELK